MRNLSFLYRMELEFSDMVQEHYVSLRCLPSICATQTIHNLSVKIWPDIKMKELIDGFGNRKLIGNVREAHDCFGYEISGEISIDLKKQQQEYLESMYKYPSKMTECGAAAEEFLRPVPFLARDNFEIVKKLMEYLHQYMKYIPGSTDFNTTAEEALKKGTGVCQDYAHILIMLCRKNNIPARYVTGLMLGEGYSHAWVEIYDKGLWKGIDPTNGKLVDEYYIKIAHGRDAHDCAVDKGIFKGNCLQKQTIYVNVEEK